MIVFSICLATLLLQGITDAIPVALKNIDGRMYIETDREHYAMYGQVKDKDGIRITVFDGDKQNYLTSRCEPGDIDTNRVSKRHMEKYRRLRENYFNHFEEFPATETSYSWTDNILDDQRDFSLIKLGQKGLILSSPYFPGKLAKVILDGKVVIFLYFDGRIVMKTVDCLYYYERALVNGIKKINTSDGILSHFASKEDKAMVRYLRSHPIDESKFETEQKYMKPVY